MSVHHVDFKAKTNDSAASELFDASGISSEIAGLINKAGTRLFLALSGLTAKDAAAVKSIVNEIADELSFWIEQSKKRTAAIQKTGGPIGDSTAVAMSDLAFTVEWLRELQHLDSAEILAESVDLSMSLFTRDHAQSLMLHLNHPHLIRKARGHAA